jgi:hypothetical protein
MSTGAATLSSNNTLRQPLVPEKSHTSAAHTVLFYEDDSELFDILTQSVCTAVMAGNSVIVIATAAHHAELFPRLKERCIEAYTAIVEARLLLMDAEETLARVMVDGQPDPTLFARVVGPQIEQLVANARGENPAIFIFGEMVALLWEQGRHDAALRLEHLSNELLASCPASILCAYPTQLFAAGPHPHPAAEICALHSCVIPPQYVSGSLPQKTHPAVSP